MHIAALLPRASDGCIDCPDTPVCSCSSNQECVLIFRDCYTCETFRCVNKSNGSSSSGSGGVSKGAMAGAVVGSLIFLAGAVFLFLWWRKQQRLRNAAGQATEVKKDTPAPAETVLNRPDPSEKPCPSPTAQSTVRVYSISSNTTIDLDPESQAGSRRLDSPASSVRSNPFDDNNSIQTAGTEGTNVIPIALVSPDPSSHSQSSQLSSPVRPPRPDTSLDNVNNAHHDTLRAMPPNYAQSQRSGVSAVTRNSYMSSASYASDLLNEAPIIMTATHGPVRQLLGVQKAEVVNPSSDGLKPPATALRPAVSSPLAVTSFGPSDVISEEHNPFNDRHSTATTHATSPATTNFGPLSPSANTHASMQSAQSTWVPDGPLLPWAKHDGDDNNNSRPSSVSTQAGSLIGFGNATRVNVGLLGRSPSYRTTMGRLVTPSTAGLGTFEEQQQRSIAHNQQRAVMQNKRTSGSSVISATSTRADSILESFPFVPPSPISNRPMRSPPVSPLAQQNFSSPPPPKQAHAESHYEEESDLPAPPDRRTLGLSTGSQLSTASSGLGSFPFQIDTGNSRDSHAPSAYSGRQRASLDTLALTSDLSSYPLGFDRDSHVPPVPKT